jgi:hypothetical protein
MAEDGGATDEYRRPDLGLASRRPAWFCCRGPGGWDNRKLTGLHEALNFIASNPTILAFGPNLASADVATDGEDAEPKSIGELLGRIGPHRHAPLLDAHSLPRVDIRWAFGWRQSFEGLAAGDAFEGRPKQPTS